MFTGLIEEVGQIRSVKNRGDGRSLQIEAASVVQDVKEGDSIAVDGVCLTVVRFSHSSFEVEAVGETLSRSTLGKKSAGDKLNLERALKASGRFGGHFVQGHVDGIADIANIEKRAPGYWLTVRFSAELERFIVEKGSITLDGMSLTVAAVSSSELSVAIIPHTWQETTLAHKKIGDAMNVEVDILAKYIQKFLQPYAKQNGLTIEKLAELGF